MAFTVVTRGFKQEFERWTDALETANGLRPQLKSWFVDIRIFDGKDLVWMYSKLRAHPEYIGPGTYDRLVGSPGISVVISFTGAIAPI